MPRPNGKMAQPPGVRCRALSGFSNAAGSRFAAPSRAIAFWPGAQTLAAHLQVVPDDPPVELDRAVVAQQLVDGRLEQFGLVAEAPQLIGMAEQRQKAVADQVARRLVASHQDQQHGGQQLLAGQPVAFLLGRQQDAHEIVPGLAPARLHDGLEIGEQLAGRGAERPRPARARGSARR